MAIGNHSSRGHAALSPSSADKWMVCWGWMRTVAAHREKYGRKPSGAAADEGTRAHERFEELLTSTGRPVVYSEAPGPVTLPDLPDFLEHEFDEDLVPLYEWVQDQPGDLYVETQVDFGSSLGYVGLTGTADLIFVENDRLTVGDLKYGRGVVEADRNLQLMTYLYGAIQKFGSRPTYRIVVLQPRAYHPEGPIRPYYVTEAEMEVFAFELERAIEENYGNGQPHPGDHCRNYCEAFGSCRAAALASRRRLLEAQED